MKIGITQGTARASGLELLEFAAKMGLTGVEPMIGTADSEYLSWSREEIRRFVERGQELGVGAPTAAMAIFNGDAALVEAAGREKAVNLTTRSLEFAAGVGAQAMLLCTYFASHPDTPEKKASLLEVIREVEPTARNRGVALALESPLSAEELAELVDAAGSDHVGIYYDVGNSVYLGFDPAKEIATLGRRILAMHVKDTAQMLGDSHLGQGRGDLPAGMEALKRIGYEGWLMLETPGGDEAAVREDIRVLGQYL